MITELKGAHIGYAVNQRVWRLETADGVGIYSSGLLGFICTDGEFDQLINKPGPVKDFGLDLANQHCNIHQRRFAFLTREQLVAWFGRDLLCKFFRTGQIKMRSFVARQVWFTTNQCVYE